ncbi:Hypothetical predicted protein, partial [Mytilus galloprovincialis]
RYRTHTDNKHHDCDVCGKTFSQRGYLRIHKRIHTGERPHDCDVCGKEFSQSGTLKNHMITHTDSHENTYRNKIHLNLEIFINMPTSTFGQLRFSSINETFTHEPFNHSYTSR